MLWFRSSLSPDLQHQLRPYLAQPYQSALKVLECCSLECPLTVEAIAQQTQLSQASVRQMLKVLQAAGLVTPAMVSVRPWRSQSSPREFWVESPQLISSGLE
ncbi:helix-turn-helix domain-containing protein [Leptolyngbya sp. PL-A3]|uniref:helix-turn-helix domain-containing protein n=1 Tax=Leptolyngbya sp. FACHB-8 TaxID=2692814 RepID=UPI001A7EF42C|nr:helix-turn-helix domain-containing protein [Leptolyngbya sp. FACHB-8]